MSGATSSIGVTLDAWAALDEDDSRELVDGRLEDEEVPSAIHETVVRWLLVLLDAYVRPRGGFVLGSGVKLAVRARSGCLPDVVVEVVSSSPRDERRDRIEKPDDYGAFGVRYYWLVDPDYRSLEAWELGADGRYVRALAMVAGNVERLPGYDGLALDLDQLWGEIDRLEAP
jgi:Uma2 family endonuclease